MRALVVSAPQVHDARIALGEVVVSPKLTEAVARYAEAVGTTVDEAETELTEVVSELAEAASAGAVPLWDAEVLGRIDTLLVTADLGVADMQPAGDAAWHCMRSTAVSVDDAARLAEVSASAARREIGERPGGAVELLVESVGGDVVDVGSRTHRDDPEP